MRPATLYLLFLTACLWTTGLTAQQILQPADADRPVTGQPVESASDETVPTDAPEAKSAPSAVDFPPRSLQTAIDHPAADAAAVVSAVQTGPASNAEDARAKSQAPAPAEPESTQTMKVFHLQNGVAADYSKLLQDIFTGTKLTANERTNAIIAAGEEQDLLKIEALLLKLDEAKSRPAAPSGSATATDMPKSQRKALAFTATWAGPCQQILPVLRSIAEQGAPIQFVDVDREPELAKRHQIVSIPAVIVEEDGREVERLVGIASRQKLERLILGRVVTSPDAPAPARSVASDTSDDPFATPTGVSVPLPTPSRSQPPGLLALESRAAELASRVRELSKTHGSEHPDLVTARQQLDQTLVEALDLKFKAEQRQVAALEQRLTRLKSQLQQRQAVQSQIVERRLRELLDSPATRWNTDEPSSDSNTRISIAQQAAEVAPTTQQSASRDQIVVDLYATDGIYQNQKLLGAVVAPLNKIPQVVVNVRMVPGDSGKFVFAIVHNAAGRFHNEATENGGKSPTKQAIEAALKAGGINDVRWEGVTDKSPSGEFLPSKGEAATAFTASPAPGESPAVDRIFVHLYAGAGGDDDKAVVESLKKLTGVEASVRIIPLAPPKLFFAQVLDPPGRMQKEAKRAGKESPTRRAIEAALEAAGIEDVNWQEAFAVNKAASVTPLPPKPENPDILKPAESLESSARVTLDLADAQAAVRETEEKLAYQTKLHAKGFLTTAELTEALQQRDRAVRRRQLLLDEYAATVKDLKLQLSAASLENDLAESDHRRLIQLVEQGAVPFSEAQDAALRAARSAQTLERLKNRLEFLEKAGEGSAVKEPSPS